MEREVLRSFVTPKQQHQTTTKLKRLSRRLQLWFDLDVTATWPLFDAHWTAVQPRDDHSTTYVMPVIYVLSK